jgi:hypothetical protein
VVISIRLRANTAVKKDGAGPANSLCGSGFAVLHKRLEASIAGDYPQVCFTDKRGNDVIEMPDLTIPTNLNELSSHVCPYLVIRV